MIFNFLRRRTERWQIHTVVPTTIALCLFSIIGCDKSAQSNSNPAPNAARSNSGASSSDARVPPTDTSGPNQEALDVATKDFYQHWSKYGDSIISLNSASGENYYGVIERKGVHCEVRPEPANEADRLNGVQWHGKVVFVESADREFWSGIGNWSNWKLPPANNTAGFWNYSMTKTNGSWTLVVGMSPDDEARYLPVDCDPTGEKVFDPFAVRR